MVMKTLVEWALREGNRQADALANCFYEGFDPSLRILVNTRTLRWDVLPDKGSGRDLPEDEDSRETAAEKQETAETKS